ncbi:YjbH domain-containing protein [Glaciecola sp. HTCC2999]|uniref:YjbH domain-containing protein n=1 Tax=Glaciecola sp. HTCC2999 TaxID=455436 RepID=UPI0000E0F5E7|nr:YjbH domain-containing protein [Glaciecola sp. HTCC2999]
MIVLCAWAFHTMIPRVHATNIYEPVADVPIDGQFSFSLTQDNIGQHADLAYQVTPWMMMGANYVQLNHPERFASFRFDALVKVRDAQGYLPAIHLGMRDFTNQANLKTPFAVASWYHKQWQFEAGADTHIYSSIGYTHPRYPLTFQASYHDQGRLLVERSWYQQDAQSHNSDALPLSSVRLQARPAKFMLSSRWEFQPGIELGVSIGDNQHWGLSIKATLDSQRSPARYKAPTTPDTVVSETSVDLTKTFENLDMRLHGVVSETDNETSTNATATESQNNSNVKSPSDRLLIGVSQSAYPYWPDAISQAHSALTHVLPLDIGSVDYVIHTDAKPMMRVHKDITRNELFKDFSDSQRVHPLTMNDLVQLDAHWQIASPQWRVSLEHQGWLGEQASPIHHLLQAHGAMQWQFDVNWSVFGQMNLDIAEDNTSDSAFTINDINPRLARTQAQNIHIPQLMLQYHDTAVVTQFGHQANLHYQVNGGYLADNWAGVGVDVLYQPWQTRLAYGISLAQLTARKIDGLLSLSDDEHLTTHIDNDPDAFTALGSVFWGTPFYDIDVALHAGRFVGQDTGTKFELRRTFDNGWQFGIWGSRTHHDGQRFSDHGLYLSIPLDTALAKTNSYTRHIDFNSHINQIENTGGYMLPYGASNTWWSQRAAFKSLTRKRESSRQRQFYTSDKANTWLLVVGGYEVTGQVRYITPTVDGTHATGGTQDNQVAYYQFESDNGDRLRFTQDGIMSIDRLAQRPLNMQFNDVSASESVDEASVLRQVTVGQLNYAAYRCSALTRLSFTASQRCESQPSHRVELQYDKDFRPVRIAQWLVYMNQHLELKRLN